MPEASKIPDQPLPDPGRIAGRINNDLYGYLRDLVRVIGFFMANMRNLQNGGKQGLLHLDVLIAEPEQPQAGMIVYADGTSWNPGGGAGAYVRTSSAWVKLH